MGSCALCSLRTTLSWSPYVAQVELKTNRLQPAAAAASIRLREPPALLSQYFPENLHALAHLAQRCKMHHGQRPISGKYFIKPCTIQEVTALKRTKLHSVFPACNEAVKCNWVEASRPQSFAGVRANIARATCDKYVIQSAPRLLFCRFSGVVHHMLQVSHQIVAQLWAVEPKRHGRLKKA